MRAFCRPVCRLLYLRHASSSQQSFGSTPSSSTSSSSTPHPVPAAAGASPTSTTPSLLAAHMSMSLPRLAELYASSQGSNHPPGRHTSEPFPFQDPQSDEDGEQLIRFFCKELDMGFHSVQKWRAAQRSTATMRRKFAGKDGAINRAALGKFLAPAAPPSDQRFLASMVVDLHAVLSPFVTITETRDGVDSTRGTQLTAVRDIDAGMFLCSIPSAAGLTANPPPSDDRMLNFILSIEDLIGQLLAAEGRILATGTTDPAASLSSSSSTGRHHHDDAAASMELSSHATYVSYLKETVVPPKNLPFLTLNDLLTYHEQQQQATSTNNNNNNPLATSSSSTDNGGDGATHNTNSGSSSSGLSSGAVDVCNFFHQEMGGEPLSDVLREALTPDEYRWYVSVVLSRRLRSGLLVPLLDKLNHHHEPNSYFTMASESEFCALDVLDNILAGVETLYLHEPYLHVFSIAPIAKGEPITMSYLDRGVSTAEEKDVWQLAWGFVPEKRGVYTEPELLEVAGLVAARRMQQRSTLFP